MTDELKNTVYRDSYQPSVGEYVELFMLDLSPITGNSSDVYYFTPTTNTGGLIQWKGINYPTDSNPVTYSAIDIKAEGFQLSAEGSLPEPTINISNISHALLDKVKSAYDLVGAKVYRYRTLSKYLVGGSAENMLAHYPEDRYVIAQKLEHTPVNLKFKLRCAIDATGKKLPTRLILRDYCGFDYRIWNGNPNSSANIFTYSRSEERCPININRWIALANVKFDNNNGVLGNPGWLWYFYDAGGSTWYISSGVMRHDGGSTGTSPYFTCLTNAYPSLKYIAVLKVNSISGGANAKINIRLGDTGAASADITTTGYHRVSLLAAANNSPYEGYGSFLKVYATNETTCQLELLWLDIFVTIDNETTYDPSLDVCAKTPAACKMRFHNSPLPFGGFPGVSRVRVR